MPYPIWASDAVLLGRALEEYLDANCDSTVYFLDFLWSRLSPFYPPIKFRERRDTVDIEDAPRDITWETAAEHQAQVGFSPSLPNSWFLRPTGAIRGCHVTLDKPVRHLMEEVAELVAKCCARSPSDDAQFNLAVEAPWGQVQQRGLVYIFDLASGSRCYRAGSDDPEMIEKLLATSGPCARRAMIDWLRASGPPALVPTELASVERSA